MGHFTSSRKALGSIPSMKDIKQINEKPKLRMHHKVLQIILEYAGIRMIDALEDKWTIKYRIAR